MIRKINSESVSVVKLLVHTGPLMRSCDWELFQTLNLGGLFNHITGKLYCIKQTVMNRKPTSISITRFHTGVAPKVNNEVPNV